jgi:hypothetical protein
VLLVGHKMGATFVLDPDDPEELLRQARVGRGSIPGGVHFGMVLEGETLYVPIDDMNDTPNGDVLDPEAARPAVHAVNVIDGSLARINVAVDPCGDDRHDAPRTGPGRLPKAGGDPERAPPQSRGRVSTRARGAPQPETSAPELAGSAGTCSKRACGWSCTSRVMAGG